MKFLILFPLLAAAASLGMADGSSHKPTTSLSTPSPLPSGSPSATSPSPSATSPSTSAKSPSTSATSPSPSATFPSPSSKPPQSKGLPPQAKGKPANSSDVSSSSLDPFIDSLSKTATNPISEISSLSEQCQGALLSIVGQPEFLQCVPVTALLPILVDQDGIKEVLADPAKKLPLLNPLFDALCAAPKCSDKLITGALQAINKTCNEQDLKDPLMEMIVDVTTFYSPIRDSICFKDNKNEFCVVETVVGVFTLPKAPFNITGTIVDNIAFAEPKSICTPCNKAIINTFFNFVNADTNKCVEFLAAAGVSQELLTIGKLGAVFKCGYEFIDGKVGDPGKSNPDDFDH